MAPEIEVTAHPTGNWLVKAGHTVLAVPPDLGRALQRGTIPDDVAPSDWASLHNTLGAALAGQELDEDRLPPAIWLRLPLLPAQLVVKIAAKLSPVASKWGLILQAFVGLAGYTHLGLTMVANPIVMTPQLMVSAVLAFLMTAIWHELGHASALSRQGFPPGGIGAGLLFVVPVLFADVTAVGALTKSARLHVDGAGMVFQFGLGGFLASLSAAGILGPVGVIASWLVLAAIMWSLFPFIKADGYWLVCDALGLTELENDPEPAPGRRLSWFLRTYRLLNAAFLIAVGVVLPLRYAARLSIILNRLAGDWHRWEVLLPVGVLGAALLGMVWVNIARRVVKLVRAAIR